MLLLKFQMTNNKSQISTKKQIRILKLGAWILFVIWCLIFGASAKSVYAKTLSFQKQQWDVAINQTTSVDHEFVRNDFDLLKLSQAAVAGSVLTQTDQLLDPETISSIEQINQKIDQPARDAMMISSGNKASNFDQGQNGQSLDVYALRELLLTDLSTVDLPVFVSLPKIPLAQTNNLGIQELIATGVSDFSGSHTNRIRNITVGAALYNGLIIPPGAEFSFNQNLGDVDAAHGFVPELVIKPEGVLPEFGGGLCQVSTTAFRAAMNAGLPITARRNHSFAVGYYAPQGTDATIYPGASDLKFINNLSSSLLIQTRIEGHKLYYDYYGTKDDRVVTFEGPTQFDRKPDGSMKAVWTRHVTRNHETTTQTFKSTYVSPALYHHDTVEQPTTLNPDAKPISTN